MRNRVILLAVSAAAILAGQAGTLVFGSAAGGPIAGYHGAMTYASQEGTVDLYFRTRSRAIKVVIRGASVQCDNGTRHLPDISFRGKATKRGRFQIQRNSHGYSSRSYWEVAGRVKDRKAVGTFYVLIDNYNPSFAPDCGTVTPQPWSAQRRN